MRLELLKLRHTGFWGLQLLLILGSVFALSGYYLLYASKETFFRIKMIYELVGILAPIVSSISIAFLVRLEEQAANLYGILAVKRRKKTVMGILLVSWSVTLLQLALQAISLMLFGITDETMLSQILLLTGGMMLFGFFYPLFHLFLHLRFGIGISLLWGVFECMQSVMYSNIQLAGGFRYIPFAWLMEWKAGVLTGEWNERLAFWGSCLLMLIAYWVLFLIWFEYWEGRKNRDE